MTTAAKIPRPARMLDGLPPDTRVVIGNVSWEFYDRFSDAVRKGENCRVAYDGKDVEIMGIGPFHDLLKSLVDAFIAIVSEELEIELLPMGSTTWKRVKVKRGIEADQCYYFDPAKIAAAGLTAAKRSDNVEDYPNPDLAVEIDISPSKIDRPGIYAALTVSEFWRIHDDEVSIEKLTPKGSYAPIASSKFLRVRSEDVTRWIFKEESKSRLAWKERLREWLRAEFRKVGH
jgi:Uma2 family endonuclease